MKVNWLKWTLVSALFLFSMTFLARSVAQVAEPPAPAPEAAPIPDAVIIISREDMEKVKTEFLFMRSQVEQMQGRLKTCQSLLYPGL